MLARTIARKTVSLSSSSVGATRSISKSPVSRYTAPAGGDHGHDDHHPHPVSNFQIYMIITAIDLIPAFRFILVLRLIIFRRCGPVCLSLRRLPV